MVTLSASQLHSRKRLPVLFAAWYQKPVPTFSDALAAVRRHLWAHADLFMSSSAKHTTKSRSPLLQLFSEALYYAT